MRRLSVVAAVLLLTVLFLVSLVSAAYAQTKNERKLHSLKRELWRQMSIKKHCRTRPPVTTDMAGTLGCGRAARLIPRLLRDVHYQEHVVHAEAVRRQTRRRGGRLVVVRTRLVKTALRYIGVPYVWGGTTPGGFDCSGLVQYVYRRAAGITLGRTTWDQKRNGHTPSGPLRPGDVVFGNGGEHEGMYLGRGRVIHAPHSGDHVRVTGLGEFNSGARRMIG